VKGSPRTGAHGRFSVDPDAQRARNAEAPEVENLMGRVAELFAPFRRPLIITASLVLIGAGLSVVPPLLIQEAFNFGLFPEDSGPDLDLLARLVGLMIAVWFITGALSVWQHYLTADIGNRVMGALRVRMFAHLQSMELGFFTRTKTGAIQSRLQNDVGGVATVLKDVMANMLGSAVTVLASFVAMLILSWQLTLIAVVLFPLMIILQRRIGRIRAKIAAKTQQSLSEMSAITQESLGVSGILLAKSFGRQSSEVSRYEAENETQIGLQVRQSMTGQAFFATVQLFMSAMPAVIYLFAGIFILQEQPITVGTIVAFTTAQARLMFPMMNLLQIGLDLQTSRALFARIFEYLDLRPTITNPTNPSPIDTTQLGRIEFCDVSFAYGDDSDVSQQSLSNVNFTVEPGQYVALVGVSGSGKTTISSLIPRFYDVSSGAVKFAGTDVRDLNQQDLIDNIGILSQETFLFNDTIRENLAYARPTATDDEIVAAAVGANIHDTITAFPDGYDTIVGERGYRLSGGEKQRLSVARVLLKNPAVLILDEATSSLDTQSERLVQETLDKAASERTTVAIAHRLSTVVNADVIMVVADGRIVESGTHSQLLSAGGHYADLFNAQHIERNLLD
jgi:ATP-binding cassette subfamily B protein